MSDALQRTLCNGSENLANSRISASLGSKKASQDFSDFTMATRLNQRGEQVQTNYLDRGGGSGGRWGQRGEVMAR